MVGPVVEEGYSIYLSSEAKGLGVCVVIYTFFSACASLYTALLYHYNGQIVVSISLIALCAGIQCLVSMSQAIIAECIWPVLMVDDYNFALTQWRNRDASLAHQPSRATPHPEVRVILAVRIIGVYLFNVESLLFFFWTWILFCSVCSIKFPGLISGRYHLITKALGLILPALQVVVTNIPQVMTTTVPMIVIYNIFLIIPLTAGTLMLLVILYKFARARWSTSWSVTAWQTTLRIWQMWDRGQRHSFDSNSPSRSNSNNMLSPNFTTAQSLSTARRPSAATASIRRKDEDRFLLLRFCLCFVVITLFQLSFIYSQVVEYQNQWKRKQPDAPKPPYGWTKHQQLTDWAFFFAGSSVGYFVFILFGTTQECANTRRRLMHNIHQWRAKKQAKKQKKEEQQKILDYDLQKYRLPLCDDSYSGPRDPSPGISMDPLKRPENVRLEETWTPLYHPGQYPGSGGRPRREQYQERLPLRIVTITGGGK